MLTGSCLGGISFILVVSRSCLGGLSVMFSVVSSGAPVVFSWCLYFVLLFGGVSVLFWRWSADILPVSRICCGCVSISVLVRV